MATNDLPAVLEVEYAAYEFPWSGAIFRDCLRTGYYCRVYENSNDLVGHGVMSLGGDECHLLNICIHPAYQRRGLGTSLVHHMLKAGQDQGALIALLEVRISNTSAYWLYTKMGFDEVGIRKNYYPVRHGREDAIILAKDLFSCRTG
jgi:ribosomal-protein-alanine N-acetyltransferase